MQVLLGIFEFQNVITNWHNYHLLSQFALSVFGPLGSQENIQDRPGKTKAKAKAWPAGIIITINNELSLKDQRDQDDPDDDPTLGSGKIVPDLAKLCRKMMNS